MASAIIPTKEELRGFLFYKGYTNLEEDKVNVFDNIKKIVQQGAEQAQNLLTDLIEEYGKNLLIYDCSNNKSIGRYQEKDSDLLTIKEGVFEDFKPSITTQEPTNQVIPTNPIRVTQAQSHAHQA